MKILLDDEKKAVLLGEKQILKPQYTSVLWLADYARQNQKHIEIIQQDDSILFRIIP